MVEKKKNWFTRYLESPERQARIQKATEKDKALYQEGGSRTVKAILEKYKKG